MTTRVKQAAKITGGITLVSLMMFGDWLLEKANPKPEVSEIRFIRDSIAVRADFNQVLMELRNNTLQLTTTNQQLIEVNQRLREICERARVGCR